MNYPKIRIKKSFLLNGTVIPLLKPELEREERLHEAETSFIEQRVQDYQEAWHPYEDRIVKGMCDVLNLEFTQNTIDTYVAPFGHSFSDPMVISTKYEPDRFIEVFTHELCHRLLTDNNKLPLPNQMKLTDAWQEIFGDSHDWITLVHIPVHLILKYIFIDVLDERYRYERDVKRMQKYEVYKKAWEYVEAHDYKEELNKLNGVY